MFVLFQISAAFIALLCIVAHQARAAPIAEFPPGPPALLNSFRILPPPPPPPEPERLPAALPEILPALPYSYPTYSEPSRFKLSPYFL